MTNLIIKPEHSARKERQAKAICDALNGMMGYRVADPDYHQPMENRAGYYTGGVKLSERGAREVLQRLLQTVPTDGGTRPGPPEEKFDF